MRNNTEHISTTKIILILGALTTLVPFSIDTYLPAVPQIAKDFGTSSANMSFSLTTFFIGFAAGQLIYGPLLDRFGRKKPLYVGLGISILASVGCMITNDEKIFIAVRFIEALGASVATVASLTMVRDFFSQKESARIFSMLILIIGTSPLLAPSIGGFITTHLGWHWIFVFLSLHATALLLVAIFLLPVKYKPDPGIHLNIKEQAKRYISILKKPQFLTFVLAGAFSFSTLFIYISGAPIIFMQSFNMDTQTFGFLFAGLSVGFVGGSQLNVLLLKKFTSRQIFRVAISGQAATALIFLLGAANHWYGMTATIAFFFVLLLCLGFNAPNALSLAYEPVEKDLGSASAMLGTWRIGIAGLASASIGLFNTKTNLPIALMISATAVIALAIFLLGKSQQEQGMAE
ncbi:MAG TPA: multidrug effflux MFS transporter [Bacteroidales bacterium]|nr:multidrug effflux MFS transporter [Bacteroidales bacterium]